MSQFARRLQQAAKAVQAAGGGYPDATTTGVAAGTVFTTRGSWLGVYEANAIVENLDITGYIEVHAANVTIRNCIIHNDGTDTGIQVYAAGLVVQDCEIYNFENAIAYGNYTLQRCNIHGMTGDGMKWGSDTLVEDNYLHDFNPGPSAHTDGAQMQDGSTNAVIRHNRIEIPYDDRGNGAIYIQPIFGPSTSGPVLIENNYLDGGGFTVYIIDGGSYVVSGITVQNNVIGPNHQYGYTLVSVPVTWINNVDSNGVPITIS